MFSHIVVGSNDLDRSKKFYDALFTAIGGEPAQRCAKAGWPTRITAGASW